MAICISGIMISGYDWMQPHTKECRFQNSTQTTYRKRKHLSRTIQIFGIGANGSWAVKNLGQMKVVHRTFLFREISTNEHVISTLFLRNIYSALFPSGTITMIHLMIISCHFKTLLSAQWMALNKKGCKWAIYNTVQSETSGA